MGNKAASFDSFILCNNLKALREKAHMPQTDVAKEIAFPRALFGSADVHAPSHGRAWRAGAS